QWKDGGIGGEMPGGTERWKDAWREGCVDGGRDAQREEDPLKVTEGSLRMDGAGTGGEHRHRDTLLPANVALPPRVTLRRASSGKSRKEKGSNRLSMGSREAVEGPGRPSGSPFLPFSWFSDSARSLASPGSASPASSPRHEGLSPAKSASQDSTLSEDSPPPSASPRLPGPTATKCSYPYHTLSQSSDEFLDEPPGAAAGWTCRQVGQWLESLNLEQYVEEFSAHGVDGPRLLHLDGAKLKALGVGSSQDRAVLKRKLKELSLAVEKERKAQEKAEKQREKQKKRDQEQR
ncbi:SAM14 protein, partial [Fregata magnificens]|nr:SAM14 protein [Fregata magnificens]